jgi:ribosomal protein S27E
MKKPWQKCPNCGWEPLTRVHKDNDIICNHCSESLYKKVDSWSGDRYVKCPTCGYEGKELVNPKHRTKCPKCGEYVVRSS